MMDKDDKFDRLILLSYLEKDNKNKKRKISYCAASIALYCCSSRIIFSAKAAFNGFFWHQEPLFLITKSSVFLSLLPGLACLAFRALMIPV